MKTLKDKVLDASILQLSLLFLVFIFVFILPLFFFKIPIQGDDIYNISYFSSLNSFYSYLTSNEITRSPILYSHGYYINKLLIHSMKDLSVNSTIWIFYLTQLFNVLCVFILIKRLLIIFNINQNGFTKNIPFFTSLLFMINPISIEVFANLGMCGRSLGMAPSILYIFSVSYIFTHKTIKAFPPANILILSSLLLILAYVGYESNVYIVFISALLFLFNNNNIITKKGIINIAINLVTLILFIYIQKFFFPFNVDSQVTFNILTTIKQFLLYSFTLFIPNIHGYILIGGIGGSAILVYYMQHIFLVLRHPYNYIAEHKNIKLLLYSLFILIVYISALSLLPYYAPRVLYLIVPFFYLLFLLLLNDMPKKIQKLFLFIIILSSLSSLLQFYILNNQAYLEITSLASKMYSNNDINRIIYTPENNGVRVFYKGDEQNFIKILTILNKGKTPNVDLSLDFDHFINTKKPIITIIKNRLFPNKTNRFTYEY